MFTTLSAVDLALDVDLPEAAELARTGGFDAVDLPMRSIMATYDSSSSARVETTLETTGMRAGGWWLPFPIACDADTYRIGKAALPDAARLAEKVGSRWCNTWIWPFSDELDYKANFALHAERLRSIASLLGEHGCLLGVEFVGPKTLRQGHRYEFISTIPETLALIEEIGCENVGLLLDSWQWYTSHGTAEDLAALKPGQVTYVHLNDAPLGLDRDSQIDEQRMLPGATGVIDVETFLQTLKALEFSGPVAVEPYNADVNALDPLARVRAARASLSAVFNRAGLT